MSSEFSRSEGSSPERPDLTLLGATLADGTVADVEIAGGHVRSVGPASTRWVDGATVDLSGYVLLGSFAEPHAHLDKAFTAHLVPNPAGDLPGAIVEWLAARPAFTVEDIRARAAAALERLLLSGVTHVRTHTDVGSGIGLRAIEALVDLREEWAGIVDVEIVALCSIPVTGPAGAENRALVRDAVVAGADLVGGAANLDEDPVAAADFFFGLAAELGVGVDLHVDETTDASVSTLPLLAAAVTAGFPHSVTASHAVSLGSQSEAEQRPIAEQLAATGISVVTLPQTNLFLQARGERIRPPRGLTALAALREAGVLVAAGGDNLQDPFNTLGRADPLEIASLLVAAGHLRGDEALAAVGDTAHAVLGRPGRGVTVGARADLVAIRADSAGAALASGPQDRIVLRDGRVVARTRVEHELLASPTRVPVGARR